MNASITHIDYVKSCIGKASSGNALRVIDLAADSTNFYDESTQHVSLKDAGKDAYALDTNSLLGINVRTLS